MKIIFSLVLVCFSMVGYTQSSVSLTLNHKVGAENLELNADFSIANGDQVSLDRCEYYISQIEFVHDGGQVTLASDVWLLVDAFDQEVFQLGDFDLDQLEAISFYVGVQTPYNNQDLTLWPGNHPLAPQNPSMHWGWASGYRFLAMEGLSGTGGAEFDFQVHALGNNNYYVQTLPVSTSVLNGEINIELDANYLEAFNEVSTAQGGITHGGFGDAVIMLENFRDAVFSQAVLSLEEEGLDKISMRIAPNPSIDGENSKLLLDLKNLRDVELEILDISGKLIYSELINGSVSTLNLPLTESGVYLISLKHEDTVLVSEKWLVK